MVFRIFIVVCKLCTSTWKFFHMYPWLSFLNVFLISKCIPCFLLWYCSMRFYCLSTLFLSIYKKVYLCIYSLYNLFLLPLGIYWNISFLNWSNILRNLTCLAVFLRTHYHGLDIHCIICAYNQISHNFQVLISYLFIYYRFLIYFIDMHSLSYVHVNKFCICGHLFHIITSVFYSLFVLFDNWGIIS